MNKKEIRGLQRGSLRTASLFSKASRSTHSPSRWAKAAKNLRGPLKQPLKRIRSRKRGRSRHKHSKVGARPCRNLWNSLRIRAKNWKAPVVNKGQEQSSRALRPSTRTASYSNNRVSDRWLSSSRTRAKKWKHPRKRNPSSRTRKSSMTTTTLNKTMSRYKFSDRVWRYQSNVSPVSYKQRNIYIYICKHLYKVLLLTIFLS